MTTTRTTALDTTPVRDWREEFHEFDDVAYLNAATQGVLPRVSLRAAQAALDWKKLPHRIPDDAYFGLPNRIRQLLAQLIGGEAQGVALTTGASGGLAAVAREIRWEPGDEVLVARGEFPAHFATWAPLAAAGQLRLQAVEPGAARQGDRFLTADDFLAHIGPRTRLVSTSLVRFDDGARVDAQRLAEACRAAGAFLLLDVSQCAGAMPLNVRELGADFVVCAGYKWLLSPYGTGFLWVRPELVDSERFGSPGPFYWMAAEGAEDFHSLGLGNWKPQRSARRWDSPETASFFNLVPMEASLEFLLRVGVETVWQHNLRLAEQIIERLPRDRCVLASPAGAARRGPYLCVAARKPERTRELYERLTAAKIIVGLREGNLRISPHLYNTERDVDRLLAVLSV